MSCFFVLLLLVWYFAFSQKVFQRLRQYVKDYEEQGETRLGDAVEGWSSG